MNGLPPELMYLDVRQRHERERARVAAERSVPAGGERWRPVTAIVSRVRRARQPSADPGTPMLTATPRG